MLTICWAAKGGSGTTVVAAGMALAGDHPCLLVDLAGELPQALGIDEPDRPGAADWLECDAPPERLGDVVVGVAPHVDLLPWRGMADRQRSPDVGSERWQQLAEWLTSWSGRQPGHVIVDAGTGAPQPALLERADRSLLVTRACYLAIRRATTTDVRPDGVVLVAEPGRSIDRRSIEAAIGAPVVATIDIDPAISRAVDAGLLVGRLPRTLARELRLPTAERAA